MTGHERYTTYLTWKSMQMIGSLLDYDAVYMHELWHK